MINEAESQIEVHFIPEFGGDVPPFVAEAFVGKTLPFVEKISSLSPNTSRVSYDYKVLKREAVLILGQDEPKAARWILDHPEVFKQPYLFFSEECCVSQEQLCPQSVHREHRPVARKVNSDTLN